MRDQENGRSSLTRTLGACLARGLAVVLPLGATLWVLWWLFVAIDNVFPTARVFGREIRGLGILMILVTATLIGSLATIPIVRLLLRRGNDVMLGIPIVRLLYSTFRDFVNAFFVQKRFDKPVLVRLGGGFDAEVIGFITRQNLEAFGLLDKVAVYFPQSYNIGGNVLILPRERLTPLVADSALVMSFIVTGGVASLEGAGDSAPSRGAPVPALPSLERCPQEA